MTCPGDSSSGGDGSGSGSGSGTAEGGGTGYGGQRDIRNQTTNECISPVIESLLATNKDIEGEISETIKKFDQSKTLNINIYDGVTSSGNQVKCFLQVL